MKTTILTTITILLFSTISIFAQEKNPVIESILNEAYESS